MSSYQHISFNDLDPATLAEFITGRYHTQTRSLGLLIISQLTVIRDCSCSMKQELQAISGLFQRLVDDVSSHLRKEEFVLFPYVKQTTCGSATAVQSQRMPLLSSVLQQMRRDHRSYADTMSQIRRLTNNYTAPDDACNMTRLCLAELQEFEYDMMQHIYLENNILFPKLLRIEDSLSALDNEERVTE